MKDFKETNSYCKKGQVVYIGSSYFANMEITKRVLLSNINTLVYDRSVEKLTIENAKTFLTEQVFALEPSKIFVNIGDEDLKSAGFDLKQFISKYEFMMLNIHRACKNCRIYITSIVSVNPATKKVNEELYHLAKDTGCTFIDFNCNKKDRNSYTKVFNILKQYLLHHPTGSSEAMDIVC